MQSVAKTTSISPSSRWLSGSSFETGENLARMFSKVVLGSFSE